MTDDEKAIRKVIERWMEASKSGDTKTVLSLMADDVVFLVPGREPFGKEAFASQSNQMSGVKLEGQSEVRELKVIGDWAFCRSFLRVTMTPASGTPIRRSGYTLTLFQRKADGSWVLARDANLLAVEPSS